MDDPWRFRPFGGGGGGGGVVVCPTCSAVHFPFCPPPRSFDPLRLLPDPHPPPFRHPFHSPPFSPAPPPPPPSLHFPNSMPGRSADPWNPAHSFSPNELFERESFHKRMRIGEPAVTNFPLPHQFAGKISLDDVRRLNLIRNHGQQDAALFSGEHRSNSYSGVHGPAGIGAPARIEPFPPPDPQFGHPSHLVESIPYRGYQSFLEARPNEGTGKCQLYERSDFGSRVSNHHMREYSNERKDLEGRDFDTCKSGGFSSQASDSVYGQDGRFDVHPQQQGYRPSNTLGSSDHYASRVPEDRPLYDSQNQLHGDSAGSTRTYAAYGPEEHYSYDSRRQASYPRHDFVSRGPFEKYDAYNQHLRPEGSSPYGFQDHLEYPITNSYGVAQNVVNGQQDGSRPMYSVTPPLENEFGFHKPHHYEAEFKPPIPDDFRRPFERQTFLAAEQYGAQSSKQDDYLPVLAESKSNITAMPMTGQVHSHLPPQILLPLDQEPSPPCSKDPHLSSMSKLPSVANLSQPNTSASMPPPPDGYSISDTHSLPPSHPYNEHSMHIPMGFGAERLPFVHVTPSKQYMEEGGQLFPLKKYSEDKPKIIDACRLFKPPHRASRPDHIVIILRGLPGSGKSYLAKALRDLEVENGGNAPRIHAMDDYFMIEVEKKVEDNGSSKSSGSVRGKRPATKKVIEYCYEPEMEEVYRSSMLKAFKKTLDEGNFTFVIVDDRNLRVADFAQFWAIAKRSGYEVYLLEANYKDPTGCAARNVHGFTIEDIQKMAEKWEEAPLLYLKLDIQSLFHGDSLNEHSIQEVDMDADDAAVGEEDTLQVHDRHDLKLTEPMSLNDAPDNGPVEVGERWGFVEDKEDLTEVKEIGQSKWSKDFHEDILNSDVVHKDSNALSGLLQTYGKGDKSVHWGDRVDKSGFSIGAVKKQSISSLVIGPGSGYNLKSNPLPEEENPQEATGRGNINESKKRFHEQLRAERESFKVVFDRRRQRIGGLYIDEDE